MFIALTLSLSVQIAHPESVDPSTIKIITPIYKPNSESFNPAIGEYTYEISWQGIPAAEARARVTLEGDSYKIMTDVKTLGMVSVFYKLRYAAEGLLTADNFLPIWSNFNINENKRNRVIKMHFEEPGKITAIRQDFEKAEVKKIKLNSANFTLDPFSAAFLARAVDWQVGVTREFDVFNGKTRYLVTLAAKEEKQLKINGQWRDVMVIVPTVKNLTDPQANQKLRSAKIYLTKDNSREILEIVSSVFVGAVKTKIKKFVPFNQTTTLAAANEVNYRF
ncbi:MAG TPA: DUF3108 domain-containing protein [Oligoflexia bacterium]|nr:DUF3108 domain-containing protein [Oligoflexia bacterium]HMP27202.1 DUF3108 domain-containing protein [Oligoflexia bacterium]